MYVPFSVFVFFISLKLSSHSMYEFYSFYAYLIIHLIIYSWCVPTTYVYTKWVTNSMFQDVSPI